MYNTIPVISFVGSHNSGKTTLLRKIIPILVEIKIRVGVIKHTHHHDFEIDHEGKDSFLLKEAGANTVIIASRNKVALVQDREMKALEEMMPLLQDLDLLLLEGDKYSCYPKVEIYRKSLGSSPLYSTLQNVEAICTDVPLDTKLRQFDIQNVHEIARFIQGKVDKKKDNKCWQSA